MNDETHFFCINLDSRADRWQECQKQFTEQNIKVERWAAKPLPENRRFGAGLSHREIIEHAKKQKWEYVGIFEDDITFIENDFQKIYIDALRELDKKEWYILYFGGLIGRYGKLKREKGVKKLFRVEKMYETHAVIYNKRFFDIYLEKHPCSYSSSIDKFYLDNKYKAFDEWLAHYFQQLYPCYITDKILVAQRNNFSDVENRFTRRYGHAVIRFYFYKYGAGKIVDVLGKFLGWLKIFQI